MISNVISGDSTSLETIEEIRDEVIEQTSQNDQSELYVYYEAIVSPGAGAYVYDDCPLTLDKAYERIMWGQDVFCVNMQAAITLAMPFDGLTPREPRPNSQGRLNGDAYHYHVKKNGISMTGHRSHIFVDEGKEDEFLQHKNYY